MALLLLALFSFLFLIFGHLAKSLMLFLLVNELPQQEVSVILLAHVLNFKVLVLLHQIAILIVYLLGYLGHGLQVLVKLTLLLLEVVLVLFLLL